MACSCLWRPNFPLPNIECCPGCSCHLTRVNWWKWNFPASHCAVFHSTVSICPMVTVHCRHPGPPGWYSSQCSVAWLSVQCQLRRPNYLDIRSIIIYLFIYCHLYSAFSIVQCSNALYRLWDGEIQGHTGQPSVREIDAHTMYNQWATAPGRSLNYPRPKSITHLRTFSDNGVYVALQLFLVIVVSDQWRRVLIPYS